MTVKGGFFLPPRESFSTGLPAARFVRQSQRICFSIDPAEFPLDPRPAANIPTILDSQRTPVFSDYVDYSLGRRSIDWPFALPSSPGLRKLQHNDLKLPANGLASPD